VRAVKSRIHLGEELIRAGLLTSSDLEKALSEQRDRKSRLGETLVDLGLVEEEQLLPLLAEQIGVRFVRLREGIVDPEVVKLLPRTLAEACDALAVLRVRGVLIVAMAEPQDLRAVDEIEKVVGLAVRPVLASRSAIAKLLPRCYEDNFAVDSITADIESNAVEVHPDAFELDLNNVGAIANGSPIINLINHIIVHAIRQGASDVHIEPGHRHTTVRFRVDGCLREVLHPRRDFHAAMVSRVKVMAKMDIAEQRSPQDGRMHVVVERNEIDLRCSIIPTVLGEKVVLRILDRRNLTFNLDELGLSQQQLGRVKEMLIKPYGLVLVTGPTGSGKTTTLYSALELIKSVERNIVTVEDPVEYQLEQINQIQVGVSDKMTFAKVLRSVLRQDPDVIMVGEIRDAETAEIAIQAALTGHLVLSTLHTNDSASAVTRLVDMGIASYKIAAALVGVIAQRLVRTICPRCRTTYYPRAEYLQMIHYAGDHRRQFNKGTGCEACFDSGCQGRSGIYEVLMASAEARRLISDNADLELLRGMIGKQGGKTLLEEGIALAETGKTSLEEVVRIAFFD
jgi:type IV pilus assembly protein PilB